MELLRSRTPGGVSSTPELQSKQISAPSPSLIPLRGVVRQRTAGGVREARPPAGGGAPDRAMARLPARREGGAGGLVRHGGRQQPADGVRAARPPADGGVPDGAVARPPTGCEGGAGVLLRRWREARPPAGGGAPDRATARAPGRGAGAPDKREAGRGDWRRWPREARVHASSNGGGRES
uniref:Uncharacterized protein n=1 Tax=Setaria viridis TaxID=4556 RepID=A0A4U6U5G5_SETVI|nr:LOW QUALITY PROTEIN: hypothetical protein SEVIR_6G198700v2 [Setaria viridis]